MAYLNLTPSVDGFHLIQSLLIVDASASLRVESLIVIIPATIQKNRLKKIPTVDGFGFWLNHHSCWLNPIKLLSPVFFLAFCSCRDRRRGTRRPWDSSDEPCVQVRAMARWTGIEFALTDCHGISVDFMDVFLMFNGCSWDFHGTLMGF